MSRLSSSQTDFAEAEMLLRRIAEMVGNCIGRELVLRIYSFIGASSGLTCWRAFIAEPEIDFVTAENFSWIPAAGSRQDAVLRLFNQCFNFFEVDSIEELELKLTVLGQHAVKDMLGIKERS